MTIIRFAGHKSDLPIKEHNITYTLVDVADIWTDGILCIHDPAIPHGNKIKAGWWQVTHIKTGCAIMYLKGSARDVVKAVESIFADYPWETLTVENRNEWGHYVKPEHVNPDAPLPYNRMREMYGKLFDIVQNVTFFWW